MPAGMSGYPRRARCADSRALWSAVVVVAPTNMVQAAQIMVFSSILPEARQGHSIMRCGLVVNWSSPAPRLTD